MRPVRSEWISSLRWDYSFPIEVKSSENDILYMSKTARLIEQAQKMLDDCDRSHVVPIYAFRLKGVKGDPWRIFTIPSGSELKGHAAVLKERIPKLDTSRNGNFIMRWNEGMKLSDFLSFISSSTFGEVYEPYETGAPDTMDEILSEDQS